jgi:arylsulfatase A-like enzyme
LAAVDLFPTLCALTQISPPAGDTFDGQDMSTALINSPVAHSKTIFWEYGRSSKEFKYPQGAYDRSPHLAVREGKWKLLINADGADAQLYNLEADPNETKNLAAQQPETTMKLKAEALVWRKALPKFPSPMPGSELPDSKSSIPDKE